MDVRDRPGAGQERRAMLAVSKRGDPCGAESQDPNGQGIEGCGILVAGQAERAGSRPSSEGGARRSVQGREGSGIIVAGQVQGAERRESSERGWTSEC
jgi:hypothetical protein